MHACMHAKSLQLYLTLNPMDCSLPGFSVHGDSPSKNTGMGCHVLLQGIFLTQGSNPCLLCLLHWQTDSLPLVPPGKPGINIRTLLYRKLVASLVAQRLKHLPGMGETWVRSLGREDPLEKEMATHSSTLAWRIPWREKPGRLQSTGSQRVGHD